MAQVNMDPLNSLVQVAQTQCLNDTTERPFKKFFQEQQEGVEGYVESDVDEQLLITIPFLKAVKIHSLILEGPDSRAPSHIKLFVNQPSFDFGNAEKNTPVQELQITKDLTKEKSGKSIPLRFVKFQNVTCLTIFVDKNHGNEDKTTISKLVILGTEIKIEGTKMDPSAAPQSSRISASDLVQQK